MFRTLHQIISNHKRKKTIFKNQNFFYCSIIWKYHYSSSSIYFSVEPRFHYCFIVLCFSKHLGHIHFVFYNKIQKLYIGDWLIYYNKSNIMNDTYFSFIEFCLKIFSRNVDTPKEVIQHFWILAWLARACVGHMGSWNHNHLQKVPSAASVCQTNQMITHSNKTKLKPN